MAINLLLALAPLIATVPPQHSSVTSLTGVTTVNVAMDRLGDPGFEEYLGLKQIRKDVENKLRLAGIKIDHSLTPHLFIDIDCRGKGYIQGRHKEYNCPVEVQFNQFVRLIRDDMEVFVTTWNQTRHVGGSGYSASEHIREAVLNIIDMFINDYFEVNPKK